MQSSRDFNDELKDALEWQMASFQPSDLGMWQDNLAELSKKTSCLDDADGKIGELELSKNKALFEADALSLARDAAQCANLFQKTQQNDRALRLAKVMHIKQENSIGASLVAAHMDKSCQHIGGPMTVLQPALDQEWHTKTTTT